MTKTMRTLWFKNSVAILSLLMILAVGVCAQSPQPTPAGAKLGKKKSPKPTEDQAKPVAPLTNLSGFGTTGRIPKFGGGDFLVNSLIFESFAGRIGIGTQTPGSLLSVNGQIQTLAGGVKFPDGTVQVTAAAGNALTAVVHDSSLVGNGTAASPLGIAPESPANRFHVAGVVNLGSGTQIGSAEIFTVPSTHQAVIEFASASCDLPSGQKVFGLSLLLITGQAHYLVPSFLGTKGSRDSFQASQPMKVYFNPGETPFAFFERTDGASFATCAIFVAGRLIPVP